MLAVIVGTVYLVTAVGVVLLLLAIPPRAPRGVVLGLLALAELSIVAAVVADVVLLSRGWRTPGLGTHVSYLASTPFIIPAGFALTYRKLDRWGILIVGVATLIAAIMVVRHLQTLGVPFGYLNV